LKSIIFSIISEYNLKIPWEKIPKIKEVGFTHKTDLNFQNYPNYIKTLKINFNENYLIFPQSVTKLEFYGYGLPNKLNVGWPKNLKKLIIKTQFTNFTCVFFNNHPENLQTLIIEGYFNSEVKNLPPTITKLKLGKFFNQSIDDFPDSIKLLKLGEFFQRKINKVPKNLETLIICSEYKKHYSISHLKNIKIIEYDKSILDY